MMLRVHLDGLYIEIHVQHLQCTSLVAFVPWTTHFDPEQEPRFVRCQREWLPAGP
jgi:hypothetical protein